MFELFQRKKANFSAAAGKNSFRPYMHIINNNKKRQNHRQRVSIQTKENLS